MYGKRDGKTKQNILPQPTIFFGKIDPPKIFGNSQGFFVVENMTLMDTKEVRRDLKYVF